eukprot:5371017-Amphidinium_carterae.1
MYGLQRREIVSSTSCSPGARGAFCGVSNSGNSMTAVFSFNIGGARGVNARASFGRRSPTNSFRGLLPAAGLRQMTLLERFVISGNQFHGVLPTAGLRSMTALTSLGIGVNQFSGLLPAQGLEGMTVMVNLQLFENRISGPLPAEGVR